MRELTAQAGARRPTRGRGVLLSRAGYPHEAGRLSHTLNDVILLAA